MCGNKNDGNVDPRLGQLALKIDAAQPWHAHIEYQAAGSLRPMAKEFLGGTESLHFKPCQSKEAFRGTTNRRIIVHHEHDSVRLNHGYTKVLQRALRGKTN